MNRRNTELTPETKTESTSISKKTSLEIFLVISSILLIIGEVTVQSYFQELYFAGELTRTHEWLANHFFNHIGNATDGFGYVFGLIIVPELLRVFSKYKDNKTVAWLLRIYSAVMLAMIGSIIFDAETTQQVTGLFRQIGIDPGIPDQNDILAGLYGMAGGVAFYDLAFGVIPENSEE